MNRNAPSMSRKPRLLAAFVLLAAVTLLLALPVFGTSGDYGMTTGGSLESAATATTAPATATAAPPTATTAPPTATATPDCGEELMWNDEAQRCVDDPLFATQLVSS